MRKRHPAILSLAALLLTSCLALIVPVSAADSWDGWGAWGFSGTAIANDDPTKPTSRLIGGTVTTVNADCRFASGQDYTYTAGIILDTEGVALRTRVHWVNSEAGFREVVDQKTGISVYPMDESIDVAVVTATGVVRYSFPTPYGYDILAVNAFAIRDSGEAIFIDVCGQTIAILKLDGTRKADGHTYVQTVTVMNGDGYVYGRLSDTCVLADAFYIAYSSEASRALIEVTAHTLSAEDVTVTLPSEQETSADWVPETAPPVTESATEPVTEPATELPIPPDTEAPTAPATETTAAPTTELSSDETDAAKSAGCGSVLAGSTALALAAAAFVLRKKHE